MKNLINSIVKNKICPFCNKKYSYNGRQIYCTNHFYLFEYNNEYIDVKENHYRLYIYKQNFDLIITFFNYNKCNVICSNKEYNISKLIFKSFDEIYKYIQKQEVFQ